MQMHNTEPRIRKENLNCFPFFSFESAEMRQWASATAEAASPMIYFGQPPDFSRS